MEQAHVKSTGCCDVHILVKASNFKGCRDRGRGRARGRGRSLFF